ncbi:unnamed protein product [Peniophora sp. CBMAI 1063]|nr:unnamed protein product [Peniophora sp. CBMAI 1063]
MEHSNSSASPVSPGANTSGVYEGVQLKGDMLDFADFALDTDHRKRRRNRTTQSCLNCHTSKRKCDRKRPCSRCIQLGLTGLCVYEVDDPAARDDPNVDETTRLRSRIAELESLVRELRGKPHPRWADAAFAGGDDAQDKWHSRASKRPAQSLQLRRHRPDLALGSMPDFAGAAPHQHSPSVKSEPGPDVPQAFPYRFSPSPDSFSTNSQFNYSPYSQYPPQGQNAVHRHDRFCPCLTNPGAAQSLIVLQHQLRQALQQLIQFPEHAQGGAQACAITRRVKELNDLLQGGDPSAYSQQPQQPQPHMQHPQQQVQQQQQPIQQHYHTVPSQQHHAPPPNQYRPLRPIHSSAESAPISDATMHSWDAGYNPYFPPIPAHENKEYGHIQGTIGHGAHVGAGGHGAHM